MAETKLGDIDANKNLVWKLVEEGFNEGRTGTAQTICHPKYRNDASVMAVPLGPAGLEAHIANARSTTGSIRLKIIDIVAEGALAAVVWQTRGKAGGYLGDIASTAQTSAWLVGFHGFEDGLIRQHVVNWEPLRLMAQAGTLDTIFERAGTLPRADLSSLGLKALRSDNYPTYASFAEVVAKRAAAPDERQEILSLVQQLLDYEFSLGVAPGKLALAGDAYLSFADFPDQRGPDGLELRRVNFASAFVITGLTVKQIVVEAGRAILRWEMALRNDGTYLGLPATGRELATTGSAYARIENGRVTQWIEVMDILRVIRQIGGLSSVMPGCYPNQ